MVPMSDLIDDDVKQRVAEAIRDRFPPGTVAEVSVDAVDVDEDADTIRFVIRLRTQAPARTLGEGLFGATDAVRRVLGAEFRGYFPILKPEIDRGAAG